MRVYLVVASRHGATTEIASVIADTLRERDVDVEMIELTGKATPQLDLRRDDVVVLGSAIYAGSWIKAARRFLDRYAAELSGHRTWLFSSGPLGNAGGQPIDPSLVATLELDSGAIGHHIFSGKLDRDKLGVGERILAAAVHAPEGDYRDWDDVVAWANGIAETLCMPV